MSKIREQLKKLMSFSNAEVETVEVELAALKLQDGTEVVVPDGSDLAVGSEVVKVDENGNQVPLPDDSYVLEDGRTITVVNGKVDAIQDAVEEGGESSPMTDANVQPTAQAADPAAAPAGGMEPDADENPVEDRITALENQVAQILELLQGMGSMTEVAMSRIEELASAPATESIKTKATPSYEFSAAKSEIEELREMRKKFGIGNSGYNFSATKSN